MDRALAPCLDIVPAVLDLFDSSFYGNPTPGWEVEEVVDVSGGQILVVAAGLPWCENRLNVPCPVQSLNMSKRTQP